MVYHHYTVTWRLFSLLWWLPGGGDRRRVQGPELSNWCNLRSSGLDVYSREGDKAYPFCREFDVLGVTFNLVGVPNGSCIVANKKSRVEKLVNMLNQFLDRGSWCGFDQSSEIFVWVYSKDLKSHLPPRQHDVNGERRPVVIFGSKATPQPGRPWWIATIEKLRHPSSFSSGGALNAAGGQTISQIELWALVILRCSFSRHTIAWIDNEAVRACAIKALAPFLQRGHWHVCWPILMRHFLQYPGSNEVAPFQIRRTCHLVVKSKRQL